MIKMISCTFKVAYNINNNFGTQTLSNAAAVTALNQEAHCVIWYSKNNQEVCFQLQGLKPMKLNLEKNIQEQIDWLCKRDDIHLANKDALLQWVKESLNENSIDISQLCLLESAI